MYNKQRLSQFSADPRHFQIVFLSTFLIAGLSLDFLSLGTSYVLVYILSALLAQWLLDAYKHYKQTSGLNVEPSSPASVRTTLLAITQQWNWRSALISGLSLALLLRLPYLWAALIASSFAIWSKACIRFNGRHIFNPANLAIVCAVIVLDGWISPGQWGRHALLLLVFCGFGFVVCWRAARADVALVFLVVYAGLVVARSSYLGDPLAIAWHQLHNGALLLFAFFMISDPRTSPASSKGRLLYAILLAMLSYWLQFHEHIPQAMLYALVFVCSSVPLIDRLWPAQAFNWPHHDAISAHDRER